MDIKYGGFWIRVLASLLDSLVLAIVEISLSIFLMQMYHQTVAISLIMFLIQIAYFTLLESSEYQGTIGKMLVGIKVTDLQGNRISVLNALGRTLAKFLSAIILLIGYLMVAFTEKKQGLHDMLAGTVVVKYKPVSVGTILAIFGTVIVGIAIVIYVFVTFILLPFLSQGYKEAKTGYNQLNKGVNALNAMQAKVQK